MATEAVVLSDEDAILVSLAREIAMDLRPLDQVLQGYGIDAERFNWLKSLPRFNSLLEAHKAEWDSAGNTEERTRLKAAIIIEEWLPAAHGLLHSKGEHLNAKTELAKLLAKMAGVGERDAGAAGSSKFSITINLGSDHKLKVEHMVPTRVIDAEAN